jgi:ATP-dependent helicase/nuclease subunit A
VGECSTEFAALQQPIPTGKRVTRATIEQRRGTWMHALLQYLTPSLNPSPGGGGKQELQQRCAIPSGEMDALWQHAQALLEHASLQRFFDPQHYLEAHNEMSYVNARGELKRIDRLVEFNDEVWVLDYKTGDSATSEPYHAQLTEYRIAMQTLYPAKKVCCALLFLDGQLHEIK